MLELLTILQLTIPLLVATFLFLGPNKYISYFTTTISSGALSAISLGILFYALQQNYRYHFGGWLPPLGIELLITPLNAVMLCLISLSAFFNFLLGYQYFCDKQENHFAFCSLFLIALTGMYGIVLTNDFFNLYVFIEISSIALYALTSIGKKEATKSAFNYLIIGTIGAILMLLGIGFLYSASGTLNIDHFIKILPNIQNTKPVSIGCYLIVSGLILKSALFPLHSWLVDLYKTTHKVTLPFISAVSTKIYIFVLIKMIATILPIGDLIIAKITFLAIIGTIITSIAAIQQQTIRGILSYSTLTNICYIILALNTKSPLTTALILIVSHSLVKFTLFILTNHIIQTKKTDDITTLQGLFFDMPVIMSIFVINAASLIGIPFSIGFMGKLYLLAGLIHNHFWFTTTSVLITSFLSLIYMWKIIEATLKHKENQAIKHTNNIIKNQKNNVLKYGVMALTLINVILGIYFIYTPFNWQFN